MSKLSSFDADETQMETTNFIKIKKFSDLETINGIDKINDWSSYVEALNKDNPNFVINDDIPLIPCHEYYCCYICILLFYHEKNLLKTEHDEKVEYNVEFLYKPHNNRLIIESVCPACFHALHNPLFVFFEKYNIDGYPGQLIGSTCSDYCEYKPAKYNVTTKSYIPIPSNKQGYYFWNATSQDDVDDYSDDDYYSDDLF